MFLKAFFKNLMPLVLVIFVAKGLEVSTPIFLGSFVKESFQAQAFSLKYISFGILCILAVLLLHVAQVFFLHKVLFSWLASMRKSVLEKLLKAPFHFYRLRSNAELFTKLYAELEILGEALSQSLVAFLSHTFLISLLMLGIAWIEPRVAPYLYGILLSVLLVVYLFRKTQKKLLWKLKKKERSLGGLLIESFDVVEEVSRLQARKKVLKRVSAEQARIFKLYRKISQRSSYYLSAVEGGKTLFLIASFLTLTVFYPGVFPAGQFFSFSLYALIFFRPLVHVLEHFEGIQESLSGFHKIQSYVDKIPTESVELLAYQRIDSIQLKIKPNQRSFHFLKGKVYVLQGRVRSGKSSFIDALLGMMPVDGKLKINDREHPINHLKGLRDYVSVVFQDEAISDSKEFPSFPFVSNAHALRMLYQDVIHSTSKRSPAEEKRDLFLKASFKRASIYIFDELIDADDNMLFAAWKEFYSLKKDEAIFIVISHDERVLKILKDPIVYSFEEVAPQFAGELL